ncbi:two-component sensor [Pseudomonas aeruginosa]|nr:two-component sensor [Pseudomonas aeruginosa]
MHVLLTEDDDLIASGIVAGLNAQGLTVDRVASAADTQALLQVARFDVLVLDLGLPDEDGLRLLQRLRQQGFDLPVLVLTARDAVTDRVAGLQAGADDYLLKPFDLRELGARLHTLQRRSAGRCVNVIEHGRLSYDPSTRETWLDGRPIELSRREQALLQALLNNRGRILSGEQLKDSVYGFGDEVESNALNVHIHHLRRKLGNAIVQTVRGLGYRLGPARGDGTTHEPAPAPDPDPRCGLHPALVAGRRLDALRPARTDDALLRPAPGGLGADGRRPAPAVAAAATGERPGRRLSAEQLGIPNGMACQVSSLRGEVLAQSHATPERALDSTASGFRDQEINGVLWRSFTVQAGDLRVSTADRLEERDVLQRSVVVAAAVPVTVALLGSLALLWLGAGQGLAPLKRIRDALTRRGADSLEPLELAALPSELKPLVETQNQLFQRIAQAIERERRLTGDAAHELRSPLTAIKTHLQVARMTEGAAAEQALAHAEEGADRLHRTLDQLLLLARVEGSLSFDDGVQCSAEDAARVAMHDAGHGDVRMFELVLADGLSEAPLEVPSLLAIAALRNLLDNALRHTAAGTRVELAVETTQGCARFHVRDHGPGIAEADLPHLTRRFWRHGKSGGSGLGLAIVQAIVQRCQCRLDFDSRADGLRVTLEMPLRE